MSILKGVKDQIDVKVTAVFDSASGNVKVPFIANYKRRTAVQIGELADVLRHQDMAEYETIIKDSVVGWRNLEGANGEELPFSQDALTEMVQVPEYLVALMEGLGEAVGNKKAVQGKN